MLPKILFILSLLLLCSIGHSKAEPLNKALMLDMSAFQQLPIQHNGRLKPLESFAHHITKQQENFPNQSISEISLLAEALFNPAKTVTRPLFIVRDQKVKDLLSLSADQKTFSLIELLPALQKEREILVSLAVKAPNTLEPSEKALLTLHEHVVDLQKITRALAFLLPLQIPLPATVQDNLELSQIGNATYLDFKKTEEALSNYVKGLPPEQVTEDLKAFIFQLSIIEQSYDTPALVRIFPATWDNEQDLWLSPWEILNSGQGGPSTRPYLNLWRDMALAYRNGDTKEWKDLTQKALQTSETMTSDVSLFKLELEVTYLTLSPYFYAVICYILSLLLCLFVWLKPKFPITPFIASFLSGGFLLHVTAIIMRVLILERPPVTTLYESILFVSAICIGISLIMAFLNRDKNLFLAIGAISGLILHLVASFFAARGDTLEVLVAVLDTNFWLATHVLIITAGYGTCLIASLLAHFYLFRRTFGTLQKSDKIIALTQMIIIISLLLTAVGTILGGIWADQSWGRFWGWDPKENGALLIVLWLTWLIHAKLAGRINNLWYMAGTAFLSVIVALAWFGVNLLGVGLHSYGFTSGIATGLILFCTLEALCILSLTTVIKQKKHEI